MNAALIRTNGFRWKICWRLKREFRGEGSRRYTVYQYRKGRPTPGELRALGRQHPKHEFRAFRIGGR